MPVRDVLAECCRLQCPAIVMGGCLSLSVVWLWRQCIVTKRLKLGSHSFRKKERKLLTISTMRLTVKFEGGP